MATFLVIEGAPGQGKSLYTASLLLDILDRNLKWHLKGHPIRRVFSNLKLNKELEIVYKDFLFYWEDIEDLINVRDCDIFWDEIATHLDARNWPDLAPEVKRFLSQYRKRGIDIYANTQDFSMIDMRARLMISGVKTLTKVLGSPDISPTKPPPKYIWGLVWIRQVENFRETNPEKKKYALLPEILFISKRLVDVYDTTQDIKTGERPRLKHYTRYCEHYGKVDPKTGKLHDCQFHKVYHE